MTEQKKDNSVVLTVERDGQIHTYHIAPARIEAMRLAQAQRAEPPVIQTNSIPVRPVVVEGSEFGLRHLSERARHSR